MQTELPTLQKSDMQMTWFLLHGHPSMQRPHPVRQHSLHVAQVADLVGYIKEGPSDD